MKNKISQMIGYTVFYHVVNTFLFSQFALFTLIFFPSLLFMSQNQEEYTTLKRKYERLRKIEQSHNADEVLLAEIQDYKVCQLLCPLLFPSHSYSIYSPLDSRIHINPLIQRVLTKILVSLLTYIIYRRTIRTYYYLVHLTKRLPKHLISVCSAS